MMIMPTGVPGSRNTKTHCINGHLYTKENSYINPHGVRQCRECLRIQKNHYKRKKLRELKTVLFALAGFIIFASQAQAVTLSWNANTDTITTGYYVYVGTASGTEGLLANAGTATTYTIPLASFGGGNSPGTFFAVVKAYANGGQLLSLPSNEVSWVIPVPTPTPTPTPIPPTPTPTPTPTPVPTATPVPTPQTPQALIITVTGINLKATISPSPTP